MKKLLSLFLCVLLASGCARQTHPLDWVTELLGTDASDYTVSTYYNTHGGFHGDGQTVLIMQLDQEQSSRLLEDTEDHFCRYPLPFSDAINAVVYGGTMDHSGVDYYHSSLFTTDSGTPLVPKITNGFYLFYDRHSESTDPSNDTYLHYRGSRNFDLAIFDADTNTLYYLSMDT